MLKSLWYLLTMPRTLRRLEERLRKLENDARFVELNKWN
jgi:hypothetical protein